MGALQGPLDDIGYVLHHLSTVLLRQSDQMLQERLDIGYAQYKILAILQHNPKVQQRRIANRLGQTEASISRQIKLLESFGMLSSVRNPQNRREHITRLTAKGGAVVEAAQKVLDDYQEPLFSSLSDKQCRQLNDAMRVLHHEICYCADV